LTPSFSKDGKDGKDGIIPKSQYHLLTNQAINLI
jgi:hypothetical protein